MNLRVGGRRSILKTIGYKASRSEYRLCQQVVVQHHSSEEVSVMERERRMLVI